MATKEYREIFANLYTRAAELIASGEEDYCCDAIRAAVAPWGAEPLEQHLQIRLNGARKLFVRYFDPSESGNTYMFFGNAHGRHDGPLYTPTPEADKTRMRSERILALTFIAEMARRNLL